MTVYLPKLEKITLRRLFDAIDIEKDGEIEMNEFIKVMKQKFEIEVVEEDFERVLKEVDLNFDGKIQFTEFLMAGCNKRQLLKTFNLESTFKRIDSDGDALLSI